MRYNETMEDKRNVVDEFKGMDNEVGGICSELLEKVDDIRFIESFGLTRSVNVGVAAGIAMYEWTRQRRF